MLKEELIIQTGAESGIDLIGAFDINPLIEFYSRLNSRYEAGEITGFEGETPLNRINYHYFYPAAKAGIAIGINYYHPIKEPIDILKRGEIASVARGLDYHLVLREKAEKFMINLNKKYQPSEIEYKIFIDNSGLIDRGSAYRAGLGFFGKNNSLISRDYGSYFFIGQILINKNINFNEKKINPAGCGDCRRCIDACPTGALMDNYQFDPRKCISYLTQKKTLTKKEEKTFTRYLYGCDLCQRVCPYNKKLKKTGEKSFQVSINKAFPELDSLVEISNKDFKKIFGETAVAWRGKKILSRNAKLIMKNRIKMI